MDFILRLGYQWTVIGVVFHTIIIKFMPLHLFMASVKKEFSNIDKKLLQAEIYLIRAKPKSKLSSPTWNTTLADLKSAEWF